MYIYVRTTAKDRHVRGGRAGPIVVWCIWCIPKLKHPLHL